MQLLRVAGSWWELLGVGGNCLELRGGARFWELLGVAGGDCWEFGIAGSTSKRHSQIRASKQTDKDALRRFGIEISSVFFTACGIYIYIYIYTCVRAYVHAYSHMHTHMHTFLPAYLPI